MDSSGNGLFAGGVSPSLTFVDRAQVGVGATADARVGQALGGVVDARAKNVSMDSVASLADFHLEHDAAGESGIFEFRMEALCQLHVGVMLRNACLIEGRESVPDVRGHPEPVISTAPSGLTGHSQMHPNAITVSYVTTHRRR